MTENHIKIVTQGEHESRYAVVDHVAVVKVSDDLQDEWTKARNIYQRDGVSAREQLCEAWQCMSYGEYEARQAERMAVWEHKIFALLGWNVAGKWYSITPTSDWEYFTAVWHEPMGGAENETV